jgi:hypoxanthine phosphoribosyltransferase
MGNVELVEDHDSGENNIRVPSELSGILLDERTIRARVTELGREISRDLEGREPVAVAILRGAVIFHADLIRALSIGIKVDFIEVSSYSHSVATSGKVRMIRNAETCLTGEDVLLVEDIVDTGLTLKSLVQEVKRQRPASLRVCSLLSKSGRRKIDVTIDYTGFEIPNHFVVGYGLDFAERFRNLPYIGLFRDPDS